MATDVDALLLRIEASATKLEKDLAKARGTFDKQAKAMEKRADDLGRHLSTSLAGAVPDLSTIGAATGATLASVLSVEAIGAYADKWRSVGNLIAAAGSETATLAATQSTVADIAERARTELEGTADLYARLTRSSKDLGASEAEVAVGTETVLKGLKISGASAAEAAATALQLSQALQSGVLGGDELRSLLEGAPVIAQAIAKEFGVGVGELKKLGSEGKLTAARVFKAIVGSADEVEAAFAKTKATTGDAFAVLETQAARWIGTSALVRTATDAVGGAITTLGANFGTVATGATALGAVLAARLIAAGLTPLVAGFASAASAATATSAGLGAVNAALAATAVRANAATIAAAGFNRAVMVAGGPIGVALLALGAAYLYISTKNREAEERAKTYAAALDEVRAAAAGSAGAIDAHAGAVERAAAAQAKAAAKDLGAQLAATEADVAALSARIAGLLETYARLGSANATQAEALKTLAAGFDGTGGSAERVRSKLDDLANSNPNFAGLAAKLGPLLDQLAGAAAVADRLRARLAELPAAVEAAKTKALEAKITPAAPAATYEEAASAAGNDPVLRALQGQGILQRATADAEMSETAKKIKDTRKKLLDEILASGGTVDPKALDLAASRIVAGEAARKKSGGDGSKDDENEYTRAKRRTEEQTVALKTEVDTVGLEEEAKIRARKAQELKTAADQADVELTPERIAEIERVSAAYAAQEVALKKAEDAQQRIQEQQRYLAETFADGISDLIVEGKSFADVAEGIAKSLAKAAIQAALLGSGPLAGLFGTSVSSSGGILGTLFKSILGFDEGGWTGPASRGAVAGVVHGQEYVFDAETTRRIGVDRLEALRRTTRLPGFADGGWTGGSVPAGPTATSPTSSDTSVPTAVSATAPSHRTAADLAPRFADADRRLRDQIAAAGRKGFADGGWTEGARPAIAVTAPSNTDAAIPVAASATAPSRRTAADLAPRFVEADRRLRDQIAAARPKGFDEGGWTGPAGRGTVTGVVHGQEYVFDAETTRRLGVDRLEALRRATRLPGFADGGWTGGALPSLTLPDVGALSAKSAGASDLRPIRVAMTVQSPDAASFRKSQTQIAAGLTKALRRGQRGL